MLRGFISASPFWRPRPQRSLPDDMDVAVLKNCRFALYLKVSKGGFS